MKASKYILETERLLLREFTVDDAAFIVALVNSPGWLKYIGDRNIRNEAQAKEYLINGPIKSYEVNGFGLSMVETRDDKRPIGMCGIIRRDTLDGPDIGFALLPDYVGKGYAFEIADATLKYAKDTLNIPTIYAITVPHNKSSIKLLEKIGLKYRKTIESPGDAELMLYSS